MTADKTRTPHHDAPIGGLKVVTESGWFTARSSGTENVYKIYAESFQSQSQLEAILNQAQRIVGDVLSQPSQLESKTRVNT